MRKRNQKVKLKHTDTGEVIEAKIILADSKQGYLAELIDKPYNKELAFKGFLDAWKWYHPNEWREWK